MKSKWLIKAAVQKGISYLPAAHRINYFFQKHVTGGVLLDDAHFGLKLDHAADHLSYLNRFGRPAADQNLLELGTGWYPVVPLLFYLTASGRVTSIDIRQWMNCKTQFHTVRKYMQWRDTGRLANLEPYIDEDRWDRMVREFGDRPAANSEYFNEVTGLHAIVGDARSSGLPDTSVDFICSNNTFEHIPAPVLKAILKEFVRVVKPNGLMSHFIDMSDHFAHFDPSIGIYNYLKFSPRQWQLLDNRIQPQNRLRFPDYLAMYRDLNIPVTLAEVREGNPETLDRISVHATYAGYSREDLAISHGTIITLFNKVSPGTTPG